MITKEMLLARPTRRHTDGQTERQRGGMTCLKITCLPHIYQLRQIEQRNGINTATVFVGK